MSGDRLQQLEEWARDVRSGAMAPQEFSQALQATAAALAEQEGRIQGVEMPEETPQSLRDEIAAGLAGVTLLRNAVERMLRFPEDADPRHLHEGLADARAANEQLLLAVQLNRRTREELERQYRETT